MSQGKVAFKCKTCGYLETVEQAGDNYVPRKCRVCGHGVRFELNPDGTGFNTVEEPENWIILSELSSSELKELGLTSDLIEKHSVEKPKNVSVTAQEGLTSKDKA